MGNRNSHISKGPRLLLLSLRGAKRRSIQLDYPESASADNPCAVSMKSSQLVRNYYVLPCCLLLLNLCVELVSYKARMIYDVLLRTGAIMGMVLFGGSIV